MALYASVKFQQLLSLLQLLCPVAGYLLDKEVLPFYAGHLVHHVSDPASCVLVTLTGAPPGVTPLHLQHLSLSQVFKVNSHVIRVYLCVVLCGSGNVRVHHAQSHPCPPH